MSTVAQESVMVATPLAPEERKNTLLHPSLTQALRPQTPDNLHIALSVKQNFSLAAEQIFVHALNRTVWIYRNQYDAVDVMISEIRNTAMESLATERGLSTVSNTVFGNEAMREFLFTLQVQFFSQFGEFQEHWQEMIGNIAASLSGEVIAAPNVDPARSLVPDELGARRYSAVEMQGWLLANNWLIMYLLVSLWGRTYTYDELRAINRRGAAAS